MLLFFAMLINLLSRSCALFFFLGVTFNSDVMFLYLFPADGGDACMPTDILCTATLQRFHFLFNNFFFDPFRNSYKISWNAASNQLCSFPSNYSLVITPPNGVSNKRNLGIGTSHVLSNMDLSKDNGIHIEADSYSMGNISTCSYSNSYLVIPPQGMIATMVILQRDWKSWDEL